MRSGEAFRLCCAGNTGAGKTQGLVAVARAYLRMSTGLVVVIDSKANRRFDGLIEPERLAVRESVSDLVAHPLGPGVRVVIFRARIFQGFDVDANAIAEWTWALRGRGCCSLTLDDEFVPSCADSGQWRSGAVAPGAWVKRSFIQGREHGLSRASNTTSPMGFPVDAIGQGRVWLYQCRGQDLALMRRRNFLLGVPPGLIESLAGVPRPFEERGEFVDLEAGQPWNGCVHKFGV